MISVSYWFSCKSRARAIGIHCASPRSPNGPTKLAGRPKGFVDGTLLTPGRNQAFGSRRCLACMLTCQDSWTTHLGDMPLTCLCFDNYLSLLSHGSTTTQKVYSTDGVSCQYVQQMKSFNHLKWCTSEYLDSSMYTSTREYSHYHALRSTNLPKVISNSSIIVLVHLRKGTNCMRNDHDQ